MSQEPHGTTQQPLGDDPVTLDDKKPAVNEMHEVPTLDKGDVIEVTGKMACVGLWDYIAEETTRRLYRRAVQEDPMEG